MEGREREYDERTGLGTLFFWLGDDWRWLGFGIASEASNTLFPDSGGDGIYHIWDEKDFYRMCHANSLLIRFFYFVVG